MGHALVVFVLILTVALFWVAKNVLATKRYEMLARGHTAGMESKATRAQTVIIWLIIGSLISIALLPHIMVIIQSFSEKWFFSILPNQWTAEHYSEILKAGPARVSISNSLFYSSISAFCDLVLGITIAWLLTRQKIPGAGALDILSMLPLAVPGVVVAFGYMAGFDLKISWLNPRENPTILLIISYSIRRLPYVVRSAYAGFQQTSITLEEASANLGASPLRTLRKITLPLVTANLIAGTILSFAFAMLEVSDGLILAIREQFFPITKMIYQFMGRIEPSAPSIACAMGVIGMIILMASLFIAGKLLGKKLGQLFKA